MSKTLNEYKCLLKCDEPVKNATVTLPAASTFGQLKEHAVKAFGLSAEAAARYTYYNVAFGFDIVPFGTKPAGDKELLVETGLRDKSVIFVRAPNDIKPPVERKAKKIKNKRAIAVTIPNASPVSPLRT